MAIGKIKDQLEVPNDQEWSDDFCFWIGRHKGVPLPLAGGRAWLRLRGVTPKPATFDLTIGNGRLALSDNMIGPRVSKADMATIVPGTYDFELQVDDTNGGTRQIRGVVNVIGGV